MNYLPDFSVECIRKNHCWFFNYNMSHQTSSAGKTVNHFACCSKYVEGTVTNGSKSLMDI